MELVTAEEVISRWTGTDDVPSVEDVTLLTLIGDAEVVLIKEMATIPARLTAGTLEPRLVKIVLSGMIQRAYQSSHDNKSNFSFTSGPFSESATYQDKKRGIYLTDDERNLLSVAGSDQRAFMINMDNGYRGAAMSAPNIWIPSYSKEWETPYGANYGN